jgi:serine/threonine protein kinase
MRSDVWSLGCVVYEMSELKSPFRNENEKMSLMDLFNNITKGIKDNNFYIAIL